MGRKNTDFLDIRRKNDRAEAPERADELYLLTARTLREAGVPVETGVFRTHMEVSLVNDGPVTILLDSKKLF